MGCDIHFHSEVKRNGKWQHYSSNSIPRHYALFSKMAGVRNSNNNIVPISKPKGLPNDVTELTKLCSDDLGVDGHSHSWFNADEIVQLHEWCDEQDLLYTHKSNFPYLCGSNFDSFKKYPEDWEGLGIEDVRYVFWFDN